VLPETKIAFARRWDKAILKIESSSEGAGSDRAIVTSSEQGKEREAPVCKA
jgi:hypothetical protein